MARGAQYPDFRAASVPCAETDPDAWFPEKGSNVPKVVLALCAGCPVMDRCRQWGIDHREVGIWGGTTEADRKSLRRANKGKAAA